ncbi:MAG: dockerin type I domain-containing protein, partial [Planctomycetaceae bacterium]
SLRRTGAHRIQHTDDSTLDELLFALGPSTTENTPPEFSELPTLTAAEDSALVLESPQFLATAFDAEGDRVVVLLEQQAAHGLVVVTPTGGLGYVPDANFNGIDRFSIVLHDGLNASEPIELSVNVTAVNDPITLDVVAAAIPENAAENVVAASIQTVNVDGGQIVLSVDDPRFKIVDQSVVVAAETQFDFETEPTVSFNVTATNTTTGESAVRTVEVSIGDVDELVVDIQPDSATIDENRVGELIAEVFVVDDGEGTQYDFAVDDERFEVLFRDLRLKPGVSLDYEAEPTVTIHITATSATGATKTEPVVITVRDIGEQASSIELTRNQVVELVRGATVGDIMIDGNPLGSSYLATVDDTRFEIVGSELKLRTSEFVRFDDQQEIQVVLTVQDAGATFLPVAGTFVLEVLANENPFHNESNPYDVNADGQVNPLDALLIINSMSRHGGPGPIEAFPSPDRFYDVNGDGYITALDALLIINFLNRQNRGAGEQSPEPEAQPDAIAQDSALRRSQPAAAPMTAAPMTFGPVLPSSLSQVVMVEPSLAEVTDREAKPKAVLPSDVELVKLRDEVLVLLETDELSDADEVEAAINDFLVD